MYHNEGNEVSRKNIEVFNKSLACECRNDDADGNINTQAPELSFLGYRESVVSSVYLKAQYTLFSWEVRN
jgi:hypothetical protein